MKNIFLYIATFILSSSVSAQLFSTLNVQNTPTPLLSEWATQNSIINFVVDKSDPNPQQGIFRTTIKLLDGTIVGSTDLAKALPVTFTRGTKVYFSKDVLQLEIMRFFGTFSNSIDQTGKLPANIYQLCVEILSPTNFQPLVSEKCRNFRVAALQLPILVMPTNNSILPLLTAQTAITFRWTPLILSSQTISTYRIQVFEILQHQQAVQALRSNQPVLDIKVAGITQYIWQPRLAFNSTDTIPFKFIWTIQTLDNRGEPVIKTDGNGESRSEPFLFTIKQGTVYNKPTGK